MVPGETGVPGVPAARLVLAAASPELGPATAPPHSMEAASALAPVLTAQLATHTRVRVRLN